MTCDQAKDFLAGELAGETNRQAAAAYRAHLSACPECAREAGTLRQLWQSLGSLPQPEPSPVLRARFYQMLDSYEEGKRTTTGVAAATAPAPRNWFVWFPKTPALQFGFSAALLVLGLGAGSFIGSERARQAGEVNQLRAEVQNMRQLVALSLMQQQSASDRLKGIGYSIRVEQSDTEVLQALLRTVNQDPNDSVRLAAVDALRNFSSSPVARRGITQSIPKQESPLVQIALIDLVTDLRDRDATAVMRDLARRPDLDSSVKQRVETALKRLEY